MMYDLWTAIAPYRVTRERMHACMTIDKCHYRTAIPQAGQGFPVACVC